MQNIKKVFKGIGNTVFYLFITVMIAFLILFVCGIRPFITMSGSMEPEILTGSICFVDTSAEFEDINVSDVIAFRTGSDMLVTHRVISICESGLETKGDSNKVSDGISTTAANFYGKTLFSIPYIGYAVRYLQQAHVVAIIFILTAASFALSHVLNHEKTKKENVYE